MDGRRWSEGEREGCQEVVSQDSRSHPNIRIVRFLGPLKCLLFALRIDSQSTFYTFNLNSTNTLRRQTPFQPSNRSTPLTLHHWRPLPTAPIIQGTAGKVEEKDPFEAFGREGNGPNVMSYSQVEYEAWLTGTSNCRVQMVRDEHFVGLRDLPLLWTSRR